MNFWEKYTILPDAFRKLRKALQSSDMLDAGLALGESTKARKGAIYSSIRLFCKRAVPVVKKGWNKYGYYGALGLLLCCVGFVSAAYRGREQNAAVQAGLTVTPVPEVTATAKPLQNTPLPIKEIEFEMPLQGDIVQPFAPNTLLWSDTLQQWQTHNGLDISGSAGEAVMAMADGVVTGAYEDALMGYVIEIDHGKGWVSRYASLSTIQLVQENARVHKGDIIAGAGNTAICETCIGTHVHVELLHNGIAVDPLLHMQ